MPDHESIWAEALEHEALLNEVVYQEKRKSDDFSFLELKSFGWEGLYKAVRGFDPDRGENFDAFAQRVIRNRIADGVRDLYRQVGARTEGGAPVMASYTLPLQAFQHIDDPSDYLSFIDHAEGGQHRPSPADVGRYLKATSVTDLDPFEYVDLHDAIGRLPVEYQEIVRLTYAEDLTLREVAEKLDVSHATIARRLEEAHEFLRHQLEGAE